MNRKSTHILKEASPIRLLEHPIYGSKKLGSYEPHKKLSLSPNSLTDTTYVSYLRGQKRYLIQDQVNNIQMVLSDKNRGYDIDNDSIVDYYDAVVMNSTGYYPFGMEMAGRTLSLPTVQAGSAKGYPLWISGAGER